MEFINIIYNILMFGWILLLIVIAVSFLLSKRKRTKKSDGKEVLSLQQLHQAGNKQFSNIELDLQRKNQINAGIQIFRLSQHRPKEVKVVRKPTIIERDTQERVRNEEKHFGKTNSSVKRYAIVNEELKQPHSNIVNFYF